MTNPANRSLPRLLAPGVRGMAHYERLHGLAATPAGCARPLYAILDRRQGDGRPRIVGEYKDPDCARNAAELMRAAGDPVELVLITAILPEVPG